MAEEVEWIISDNFITFHPWWNVVASCIGYAMFGFILSACLRDSRLFSRRMPDVLFILLFAFFADLAKIRMYLYFIFIEFDKKDLGEWVIPTTIAACTLGVWITYAQFLITFVEAIVSIYRFIVRFLGKSVHVSVVYVGVGCFCAVQAALLFETFLHGTPEDLPQGAITCTRAYTLKEPMQVNWAAMMISMPIAPILSVLMIVKGFFDKRQTDVGVSAFTFLSSFNLAVFAIGYTVLPKVYPDLPDKYKELVQSILLISYFIEDFRFPLLCLYAAVIVEDIRDSVACAIMSPIRKLLGRQETHVPLNNEA